MGIGELKPTETKLKLADRSTIQPVGYVEEIPVKIEGIYILTDFMVVDIEEDHDCPMILGRPFLTIVGVIVDVKNGMIVFQVTDEMVGFELENVMKGIRPSMARPVLPLARPCQPLPCPNTQKHQKLSTARAPSWHGRARPQVGIYTYFPSSSLILQHKHLSSFKLLSKTSISNNLQTFISPSKLHQITKFLHPINPKHHYNHNPQIKNNFHPPKPKITQIRNPI
ncbi:hypothetical protein MTR_3g040130 [Medicago truncatula]|uniref:Uncharacterized protein n=1 Tax=Medicago truncatula TaxID=3880 RepID=A0A072V5M3_MEDTR|nr:hypothetical protein MTR_3g040130 [Medicago truncatula]